MLLSSLNVVGGLETALHFNGSAIDGPFQLYNSLRRIAAGQTGGVDFQFFHGLGIPYLHYLPFLLFGGTFQASEVTRQLMSGLLYPLTVVVFLRAFMRDWTRVFAWATVVIAGSIALRMLALLVAINSLLGVRSTLATLLPILLFLPARRSWRVPLTALALGGSLVLGTEQGLAIALAIALATVIVAIRREDRREWIAEAAAIIGGGVVTLIVVLTLIGGVHGMRAALHYNFKLVPMDQYWYFGAPPNIFISSWHVFPAMMAALPRIPITLLVGVVAVALTGAMLWRDADRPIARRRFAIAVTTFYGLISCASLLGTYVNSYIQPLQRVLLLVGAVLLDEWFTSWAATRNAPRLGGVSRPVTLTAIAASVIMVAVVPSVGHGIGGMLPHFVRAHLIGRQGIVYSGIWPQTITRGQAALNARRSPSGEPPTLWSTYAGLLEARNGVFNPTFDYIIHALGPDDRAAYVDTFKRLRPTLVQTMNADYTQYEAWIEATSWDFYAELLRGYEVADSTPWSLFWQRRAEPLPAAQVVWEAGLPAGSSSVALPAPPADPTKSNLVVVQVELDYRTHNLLRMLPIVGTMPRYLVSAAGAVQALPITLDPFVTQSRFPLVMERGKAATLTWHVHSLLPGASIVVSGVRLSEIPVTPKNDVWLQGLVRSQDPNRRP
ncbi:MAG TPA: hypothetical protein VFJ20_09500 [Gemmatimonadaceae bacterium]|nr:hypothetical protein [Gemmatimonadaceae bacterium]